MALWAPVAAHMVLIFALSSIARLPELPDAGLPHLDKVVHAALYGLLCFLFLRARTGKWRRPLTAALAISGIVFATVYGITDEVHQWFVPPRETDAWDLAADTAGAALAAGLLYAGIIRTRHDL